MGAGVVLEGNTREVAVKLVSERFSLLEEAGRDATAQFFQQARGPGLWMLSVKARGELAALRARLEQGHPLSEEDRAILCNLLAKPPLDARKEDLLRTLSDQSM